MQLQTRRPSKSDLSRAALGAFVLIDKCDFKIGDLVVTQDMPEVNLLGIIVKIYSDLIFDVLFIDLNSPNEGSIVCQMLDTDLKFA